MPDLLAKTAGSVVSASNGHAAETPPPIIRVGAPATLLLEGNRVHIRLHVVFAQSGHVGDTVRVTSPDRKQVYLAEVLTPELLKGEL